MVDTGYSWLNALIADTSAWSGAAFICLLLLMFGLKGRTFLGLLDKKAADLISKIRAAEEAKIAAQTDLTSIVAQHQAIFSQASAIRLHAQEEADRLMADAQHRIAELARHREEQMYQRITLVEAEAIASLRNMVTTQALAICRHYLQHQLSGTEQNSLMTRAVGDLPTVSNSSKPDNWLSAA
jgi:F0F1-type ATP synthase membrane subunit b/b'